MRCHPLDMRALEAFKRLSQACNGMTYDFMTCGFACLCIIIVLYAVCVRFRACTKIQICPAPYQSQSFEDGKDIYDRVVFITCCSQSNGFLRFEELGPPTPKHGHLGQRAWQQFVSAFQLAAFFK
jgi:hypothetical protein